ncbi:YhdP family protein [Salinicola aestuarinus]|uniref:YhdP family phospholipid transporter n=1 Tax=Salinicola aestuarinus TaxID=1949082 RepID=UPI000DA1E970|nr:AsmA-like C-terminal region-containing protein [Salinicola aestuarinus]
MSRSRAFVRWILTPLAVVLVVAACLVSAVRLVAWQSDRLAPWAVSRLAETLDAEGQLGGLSLDLVRFNPSLDIDDLTLTSRQGRPLLEIGHLDARLDGMESWRQRSPVLAHARLQDLTLHLYADPKGGWRWPDGAGAAWFGADETPSDEGAPDVDAWLRRLAHQHAEVAGVTLALHSGDSTQRLRLDRLQLASAGGRVSLQAALADDAGSLRLAVENADTLEPTARFAAEAALGPLSHSLAALSSVYPTAVTAAEGRVEVSGTWASGGLQQALASVDLARLALIDRPRDLSRTLTDLHLDAQLDRDADGAWQLAVDNVGLSSPGLASVAWPRHLQARSTADGWRLRTPPFALDGLTGYLALLPMSAELSETLVGLAPTGHVAGLEVGRSQGEWYAQSALEGVSVSPWDDIPGGGPVDAWATVRGRSGSVTFAAGEDANFAIPSVYADPLDLTAASGTIDWALTARGAVLSGERLKAKWRGATASGRFGLTTYDQEKKPGHLRLELDFGGADARGSRLLSWLPTRVIDDPDLREWLGGDIGGIVERGALRLSLTLTDKEAPDGQMFVNPEDSLSLSLDVADGRLQYDPEWPALERVYGHLDMHDMNLEGRVTHATSHGLTTRNASVTLENERLAVEGDIQGSSRGLLEFLGNAPIEGAADTFGLWQSEGEVDARLQLSLPMDDESDPETDLQVTVEADADIQTLTFPEVLLTLSDIDGALRYRRLDGNDFIDGKLGARAFEGPLLADFNIGGAVQGPAGISLSGRARGAGLLDWAGVSGIGGLIEGAFPYHGQIAFDADDNASFRLRSDLAGLAIQLPPPFGKSADHEAPLAIDADIAAGTGQVTLDDAGRARWRTLGDQVQGQVWLEGWPGERAAWPSEPGWYVLWRPDRLDTQRWVNALTELSASETTSTEGGVPTSIDEALETEVPKPVDDGGGLKRVAIATPCVLVDDRCLGGLQADASPLADGWQLSLGGGIVEGRASWQPKAAVPVDIDLARLNLDALTPDTGEAEGEAAGATLLDRIEVAPRPLAMPDGLDQVPAGHVRINEFARQGERFGPLEARWRVEGDQLTLSPFSLQLGEIEARGSLAWEGAGEASLTRADVEASGGNLATAFRALGAPAPITSDSAQSSAQLSWPGAPWQFALPRASGRARVDLGDGRLRQLHSPSAKLVGLFNLDNILRRLQLDFSDVTDGGTAFNRLHGSATLYNGVLETQGPLVIDGASTRFTLAGSVDLNRQRIDQRLGITVPVSQNLPLVAVLAGAPQIGAGLFLFHQLFGQWVDSATQIYYRVEGPLAEPNIYLESAE